MHNPALDGDPDEIWKVEAFKQMHGCTFCTVKRIKAEFAKGAGDPREYVIRKRKKNRKNQQHLTEGLPY